MAVKLECNPPAPPGTGIWRKQICQGSIYQYSLIIEVAVCTQLSDTNRLNQSHVKHESGIVRRPQ